MTVWPTQFGVIGIYSVLAITIPNMNMTNKWCEIKGNRDTRPMTFNVIGHSHCIQSDLRLSDMRAMLIAHLHHKRTIAGLPSVRSASVKSLNCRVKCNMRTVFCWLIGRFDDGFERKHLRANFLQIFLKIKISFLTLNCVAVYCCWCCAAVLNMVVYNCLFGEHWQVFCMHWQQHKNNTINLKHDIILCGSTHYGTNRKLVDRLMMLKHFSLQKPYKCAAHTIHIFRVQWY